MARPTTNARSWTGVTVRMLGESGAMI
jgi:hypothetical protein